MDYSEQILQEFLLNEEKHDVLKNKFHRIRTNIIFSLGLLTLRECNGGNQKPNNRGYVFTEAVCFAEIYKGKGFHLESVFRPGFDLLDKYINNKLLPEEQHMKLILSNLITFLFDDESQRDFAKIRHKPNIKETDLTVRLSHHLFSMLTVGLTYKIDKYSKERRDICQCGCDEKIDAQFVDTSIGNPTCWHDYLDIILSRPDLGVKVAIEDRSKGGGSPTHDSIQSYIEKEHITHQLIAQTIVFSFLQKQNHPRYEQFLIPSIGVSNEEIIFYFYDPQHDILLRSRPFEFFDGDEICGTTILVTWLVLNYKYLCSGITEGMMESPKTNFFNFANNLLPMYENQLSLGNIVLPREPRYLSLAHNVPDEFDFSEPYVKRRRLNEEQ